MVFFNERRNKDDGRKWNSGDGRDLGAGRSMLVNTDQPVVAVVDRVRRCQSDSVSVYTFLSGGNDSEAGNGEK